MRTGARWGVGIFVFLVCFLVSAVSLAEGPDLQCVPPALTAGAKLALERVAPRDLRLDFRYHYFDGQYLASFPIEVARRLAAETLTTVALPPSLYEAGYFSVEDPSGADAVIEVESLALSFPNHFLEVQVTVALRQGLVTLGRSVATRTRECLFARPDSIKAAIAEAVSAAVAGLPTFTRRVEAPSGPSLSLVCDETSSDGIVDFHTRLRFGSCQGQSVGSGCYYAGVWLRIVGGRPYDGRCVAKAISGGSKARCTCQ